MPPAVAVHGLAKRYHGVVALDGATWSAPSGRVTAVLGPNGAGKTTMVECCEGLRRPDAGEVRVLGADPWHASADHRARVGVMLQDGGLPNAARPLPLLRHLSSLYAAPADLEGADGLVARLGIDAFGGTSVRRLSGGQRQRVALAAALVGRPEVAFLDEPTAGVDVSGRQVVRRVIRELADGGACVLMATHELDEAERLADRVVIVDHGRLLASGTPAELTAAGAGERISFGAPPGLDTADLAARLVAPVVEVSPGEYRVDAPAAPSTVATLTGWLAERDLALSDLRAGRQSLEDVFLRLTAGGPGTAAEPPLRSGRADGR